MRVPAYALSLMIFASTAAGEPAAKPSKASYLLTPSKPGKHGPLRPSSKRWLWLEVLQPLDARAWHGSRRGYSFKQRARIQAGCKPGPQRDRSVWRECKLAIQRVRRVLSMKDTARVTIRTNRRRICAPLQTARYEVAEPTAQRRLVLGFRRALLERGEQVLGGALESPCRPGKITHKSGGRVERADLDAPVERVRRALVRRLKKHRWPLEDALPCKRRAQLTTSVFRLRSGTGERYLMLGVRRCDRTAGPSLSELALVNAEGRVLDRTPTIKDWPGWRVRVQDLNGDGWDEVLINRLNFEAMDTIVIVQEGDRMKPRAGHPVYGT